MRGPAAAIAYDEAGRPTKAAQGFARSRGVEVEELQRRDIDGREYVVAVIVERGRTTAEVLAEALPQVLSGLRFGKSMRWNTSNTAFSRPIRWIVACSMTRWCPLSSLACQAAASAGHPLVELPEIEIATAASYDEALAASHITSTYRAAKRPHPRAGSYLAQAAGGSLMSTLISCANWPSRRGSLAICGSFDDALRLPVALWP